jgi:hypothetical protein
MNKKYIMKIFDLNIIKTFVEDKKFVGFLVDSGNGDTQYMTANDFQNYLNNKNKKLLVRFPNEIIYDEMFLDLEKFEISNEFEHEYFGLYDNEPIALKKNNINNV